MYPSLENKTISGAFFKPPIDTLPEKFFYATKDYCVEKEEIEKNVWLFILPFQKTKENKEQLNKYDLTIFMERSEIKFDDITGFSEIIMSDKYFISKNGYLKIYSDGWLGLTDKGRNLITQTEEFFEDELDILDYKIRVIIPNTKEFWNIQVNFSDGEYWFDFTNKPKKIFIEINNSDHNNEYAFEEIPPIAAYINFYNLETKKYDIKYLVEAKVSWSDYYNNEINYNVYKNDEDYIYCEGLVRLGNNLFLCTTTDNDVNNINLVAIVYKLETLDDSKKIITDFSNGIYQVTWMKEDRPYKVEYKTLDTEAKDKLYIEDDSNFYIAQWREE